MNFIDSSLASQREAKLKYMDADYQVLREGDFVRCAVSGGSISLENLRYWDVERQLAFGSAELAFEAFLKRNQKNF